MADLGNSKIKDTYTLVLQTDGSGNLQNLDGTTPSPFIINGNLRYVDGSQALNYVLTSDASGNASWSEAGGTSYWSANTDGTISPSGLTTSVGIGTTTPNKPLTVVGDISGTTDLYLGNSTNTASTITAHDTLTIKGNGLNDYLYLANDHLSMFMDGSKVVEMTPTDLVFNASSQDVDFHVNSDESGVKLLRTIADKNIVRLSDYVSINKPTTWNWENEQKQALAVSGTSVFYSGGSSHNTEAIVAIGNISGTTDLYLGDSVHTASTITGEEQLTIKGREIDNDWIQLSQDNITFYLDNLSFASFTAPTHPSAAQGIKFNINNLDLDFSINGDDATTIFQTDATRNVVRVRDHLTIGPSAAVTWDESEEWGLAVTGSSLLYSGGTNHNTEAIVAIGDISGTTDLHIDGDTYTTDLVLDGGKVRPKSSGGEVIFANADHGSADWLSLSQDLFDFKIDGDSNFSISPTQVTFNALNTDQDFQIKTDSGNWSVQTNAEYDLLALTSGGGTAIGGTTARWPTANGYPTSIATQTLRVNGITTIYSGGPETYSWSGDTTALSVVGNISGTTDLYIDANMYSGTTNLVDIFASSAITNQDVYWSANTNGSISTSGDSTNLELGGDISLVDNGKILLGNGGDLSITHNSIKSIITNTTGELLFENEATDADIRFKGDDDGDTITALTLDMSEAGAANFNSTVTASGFVGNVTGNADTVTNGVYTTNNLSVMASTTSAQLAGVISDETGSGSLVFGTSPTLVTPALGTPASGVLTNATGYPGDSSLITVGVVTTGTWASNRKFVLPDAGVIGDAEGDIVYFGTESVTEAGKIYYYTTSRTWVAADASAAATATGLLAVALGTTSTDGMLARGMVTLAADPGDVALPIYLSETAGRATTTIPTTAVAIVRVLGYSVNTAAEVWFNPDNTWVELS